MKHKTGEVKLVAHHAHGRAAVLVYRCGETCESPHYHIKVKFDEGTAEIETTAEIAMDILHCLYHASKDQKEADIIDDLVEFGKPLEAGRKPS